MFVYMRLFALLINYIYTVHTLKCTHPTNVVFTATPIQYTRAGLCFPFARLRKYACAFFGTFSLYEDAHIHVHIKLFCLETPNYSLHEKCIIHIEVYATAVGALFLLCQRGFCEPKMGG